MLWTYQSLGVIFSFPDLSFEFMIQLLLILQFVVVSLGIQKELLLLLWE